MKQILIITRITGSEDEDEFRSIFYKNREKPVRENFNDLHLDIYSGYDLYDDEDEAITENIRSKIDVTADKVLIVVHSIQFEHIKSGLIKLQKDLQVRQYSSEDSNYGEITKAVQGVLTDATEVETIYKLFSSDYLLEAKLELLHGCIIPENVPAEEGLDKSLLDAFRNFKACVEEIRKNKTDELTWENKDYIEALTELRISLLGS